MMDPRTEAYLKDLDRQIYYESRKTSPKRQAKERTTLQSIRLQNHRLSEQLQIQRSKNKIKQQKLLRLQELQKKVKQEEKKFKSVKDLNAFLKEKKKSDMRQKRYIQQTCIQAKLQDTKTDQEIQQKILNLQSQIQILENSNLKIQAENQKKDFQLFRLNNLRRNGLTKNQYSFSNLPLSKLSKSSSASQLRTSLTASVYRPATATKIQKQVKYDAGMARSSSQYGSKTFYSSAKWVSNEQPHWLPTVKDIQEIKSLASPPSLTLQVMNYINLLFNVQPDLMQKTENDFAYSWRACQRAMNNPSKFYQMMLEFDVTETPLKLIRLIDKNLLSQPNMSVGYAKRVSKPLAAMLGFLQHVVDDFKRQKL